MAEIIVGSERNCIVKQILTFSTLRTLGIKTLGFFTFKETKMLDRANIQPMPSHVILTPEQKIALIRAKVERAESQLKALAELAKKLKER